MSLSSNAKFRLLVHAHLLAAFVAGWGLGHFVK
jgi:hypothetical protein